MVVPFSSVVRFGPSAVMVDGSAGVVPASSDARVNEILGRKGTLLGSTVVSEGGEELGTVADLYFEEVTGRVVGYEVSGGRLRDVTAGSSFLPFESIRTVGEDIVVATDDARAATAQDGRSPDGPQGGRDEAAGAAPKPTLVGSRSRTDLLDRSGSVIVASGQVITDDTVERARAAGVSEDLYDAAGIQRTGVAGPDPGQAIAKAADTASELWGRFTTKLSEMTDAAGQRVDTQQTQARLASINDAIGRPVTKVFLDRDDSVILDLGDLVTHQSIQRAADAGLLDSLLGCVYKGGEVTFTRDEMRAEIAGDSTVDKASGGASVVDELASKIDEASKPSADEGTGGQGQPAATSQADEPESEKDATTKDLDPGQTIGQRSDA
jgi:sporulation protein YlmC with PRC-barrel domain